MVQHDRRFPKLAMAHYVLQLAYFAIVATTADPSEASKQYDVLLVLLVRTLVWFNFFRVSDRAANTFVR